MLFDGHKKRQKSIVKSYYDKLNIFLKVPRKFTETNHFLILVNISAQKDFKMCARLESDHCDSAYDQSLNGMLSVAKVTWLPWVDTEYYLK